MSVIIIFEILDDYCGRDTLVQLATWLLALYISHLYADTLNAYMNMMYALNSSLFHMNMMHKIISVAETLVI